MALSTATPDFKCPPTSNNTASPSSGLVVLSIVLAITVMILGALLARARWLLRRRRLPVVSPRIEFGSVSLASAWKGYLRGVLNYTNAFEDHDFEV